MTRGVIRDSSKGPARDGVVASTGYGRARLWLGISGVGTLVSLAGASLALDLPGRLAPAFGQSLAGHALLVLVFLLAYAALQVPFDLCGGYLLPRRFGRTHPSLGQFMRTLFRGAGIHTLMLMSAALVLLLSGRWIGMFGVIAVGVTMSIALLMFRKPLACLVASLRDREDNARLDAEANCKPRVVAIECEDEGFTGGITGVLRPRETLIPAHWFVEFDERSLTVIRSRRQLAIETGAWLRGRLLALVFTWIGIALAALLAGSDRLSTGEGILAFSLWFTLWSFLGLLTLPTPSRAGVVEVDSALRASGVACTAISETIRRLDDFQDREPERSAGVEAIFHPVPAVRNRIEAPLARGRRGFLDAARTSLFLSPSGLGLLGRAVHCNCGRPALWVFPPTD